MFDSQKRLVVYNKRYSEMYRLTPAQLKPGTPSSAIAKARMAAGSGLESQDQSVDPFGAGLGARIILYY